MIDNTNQAYGSDFAYGVRETLLFHKEMEERRSWMLEQGIKYIKPEENYEHHFVLYKFLSYEDAFAFQLKFRGTAIGRKRVESWVIG